MAEIYCNGIKIAETNTGKFVLLTNQITDKNKQLIELINQSPSILKRIMDNNLPINIESSQYNPNLNGIAPGYVTFDGKIYALAERPLFFLFIIIAFESVNYSNPFLAEVRQNPQNYKSADVYAKAVEEAEFKTYDETINDILPLYQEGKLPVPWYVPFTTNKNSLTGLFIRFLSWILPAKLMIRYLCPMDLNDWLYETDRKPWYFFGKSHTDGYREAWEDWKSDNLNSDSDPTPFNQRQDADDADANTNAISSLAGPSTPKHSQTFFQHEKDNPSQVNIDKKDSNTFKSKNG